MAIFIGYTEEDTKNSDAVIQGLWSFVIGRYWFRI